MNIKHRTPQGGASIEFIPQGGTSNIEHRMMKTAKKVLYILFVFYVFFPFLLKAEEPLLKNPGFDQVDPEDKTKPINWEKPDGLGVQWIDEKGRGKVMCLDTSVTEIALEEQRKKVGITEWKNPKPGKGPVAAFYGLSFYSDAFKIKPNTPYRVTFDFKASKPTGGGKLWMRGYGEFRGRLRRIYETYVACRTKDTKWKTISQCFHPTKHTKKVTDLKVMLFAYWPPGKYYFDNFKVEPVTDEEYEKDKNENVPEEKRKKKKSKK